MADIIDAFRIRTETVNQRLFEKSSTRRSTRNNDTCYGIGALTIADIKRQDSKKLQKVPALLIIEKVQPFGETSLENFPNFKWSRHFHSL